MPALVFNTCCGCIELRTGCLIIGYLNLIGELLLLAMSIVGVAGGSYMASQGETEKNQTDGVAATAVSAVFLLIAIFLLAFTIILLVGIHKNKRGHVKAYLVVTTICMVLVTITTLASFAGPVNPGGLITHLIGIAINIYYLLVIRSYYYKMDDKRPAVYNAA